MRAPATQRAGNHALLLAFIAGEAAARSDGAPEAAAYLQHARSDPGENRSVICASARWA